MSNIVKAIQAQVQLGSTMLDGFQLPNGQYILSAKQATEVIGIRHSRVAEICATKEAQSLTSSGLDFADFSPIKFNSSYGKHYRL